MIAHAYKAFFGAAVVTGSNILLMSFAAHYLPMVEFVVYRQLFLVQNLAMAVSFGAIPAAVLYYGHNLRGTGFRRDVANMALALSICTGTIIATVTYLSSDDPGRVVNSRGMKVL
jgi:dolichyl-phosphate-mannose--protein O-mannosyl transferase